MSGENCGSAEFVKSKLMTHVRFAGISPAALKTTVPFALVHSTQSWKLQFPPLAVVFDRFRVESPHGPGTPSFDAPIRPDIVSFVPNAQ